MLSGVGLGPVDQCGQEVGGEWIPGEYCPRIGGGQQETKPLSTRIFQGGLEGGHHGQVEWNDPLPQTSAQVCVRPTPAQKWGHASVLQHPFSRATSPACKECPGELQKPRGAPRPHQAPRSENRQLSGALSWGWVRLYRSSVSPCCLP